MIEDLQPGEVVVAEKIDCISRLPLPKAERLIETIRARCARLAIPGILDMSELVADTASVARIVLEAVQDMLLRVPSRLRETTTRPAVNASANGSRWRAEPGAIPAARPTLPSTAASSRYAKPA